MTTVGRPARYRLGAEEREFKATVRSILEALRPLRKGRELAERTEVEPDDALWSRLAQAGVPALLLPEDHGGDVAGAMLPIALAIEECGRLLAPDGLLVSSVVATTLLADGRREVADAYLPAMAEGRLRAALIEGDNISWESTGSGFRLSGTALSVLEGGSAGLLLVAAPQDAEVVAVPVPRAGVSRRDIRCFDATRRYSDIFLSYVEVSAEDIVATGLQARRALDHARRRALVAVAADALGGTLGAIELAVDYAKQREQFGRPIGSFQGIKHMLADSYVRAEVARSVVYHAARVVDREGDDLVLAAAKALAGDAYLKAAGDAIQVHGGSGFTKEIPAYLYFQRARTDDAMYGTARRHFGDIGRLLATGARTGW